MLVGDATAANVNAAGAAGGTGDPVVARALTKRYGDQTVVSGIDFEVARGQCFGFLGPNGAGKTTTLRMILGLTPITAGSLNVFGLPMPASGRSARARMGVVPQGDSLDPDFTVVENLRVYASYFGVPRRALDQRVRELLAFVELDDRLDAPIATLSGGMRRRLAIARALVNDPELLILDEPTTGLDPQARHVIWARLRSLRAAGKTLLLTTHYMEEAERLCDELVVMDHGAILARGAPPALVERYVAPHVFEVRGGEPEARRALDGDGLCRLERAGDTLLAYARCREPVLEALEGFGLPYFERRANLEDVFLQLTGRELRD